MKKILCMAVIIVSILSLAACGSNGEVTANTSDKSQSESAIQNGESTVSQPKSVDQNAENSSETIDVDLTKLSSTMVYSEVYNMMATPEKYTGKKVKMSGAFSVYQDETTKKNYFSCVISDATACCSQGLEFVLKDKRSYPDDYPALNSEITVTGTFDTYQEDGYFYCQLVNSEMSY